MVHYGDRSVHSLFKLAEDMSWYMNPILDFVTNLTIFNSWSAGCESFRWLNIHFGWYRRLCTEYLGDL